jgi:hypothetical protein
MTQQMRTLVFGVVSSLTAVAVAASSLRAQSVQIQPKYKSGEKTYLEQDVHVKQKMQGGPMGDGMEIEIQKLYGLWHEVKSVNDGMAKIVLTFDRALQAVQSPMMEAAFDTDDPDNEDASPFIKDALAAMVGNSFRMEVDREGQVKKFEGMKDILEKVMEAAPASPFTRQLQNELSDERGKVTWGELVYLMYPNKEVKAGDKWSKVHRDIIPQLGKVKTRYEYKLDRITEENGRKVAVVTYKSEMEKDDSGEPAGELAGGKSEVKGSFTGTDTYDIERGLVTRHESSGKLNVRIRQNQPADEDDDEDADEDNGKSAQKKDKDDDDAGGMKVEVELKQKFTLLSESERARQKADAAKKAEAAKRETPKTPVKKAPPAKQVEDDEAEDDE